MAPPTAKSVYVAVALALVLTLGAGDAQAQTAFDFDTTGPKTTAQLPLFFDFLGVDKGSWFVSPNVANPSNASDALHTTSNGNQLTEFFSRVAILKAGEFFAQDCEVSADITWEDNDNAGIYIRFQGDSDDPLGNDFYHVRGMANGSPGSIFLHRVKGGVETLLASGGPAISQGETHNISIKAEGSEITVLVDGIPNPGMNPFVDLDPLLSPGRVGVGQETNPTFFDNIVVFDPARPPPVVRRPTVDLDSLLAWDHPDTDIEGKPDAIVEAEVALSSSLESLPAGDEPLAAVRIPSDGPGTLPLVNLLRGRDRGIYRVWARVRDQAGNWSVWSQSLEINFGKKFIRGDANSSSEVDVSDAVATLAWLFLDGEVPCLAAANANGDQRVDIGDPVYSLIYSFRGGPLPLEPFPTCGTSDLEADENLGCRTPSESCQ